MPQFPLVAFLLVLLALLGAAFTGHLPPADLVRDLLLLALPGAGAVLRSLRPAGAAAAEVRLLDGLQLQELAALSQRLMAAEQNPELQQAGAELGALLMPPTPILRAVPAAEPPQPAVDNRPPPTPIPGSGRLTRVPIMLLVPFLLVQASCSPALRGALLACAAAEVPPTVSAAAELALHEGEGWEAALARLVLSAGECAVRAAVQAVANRPPAAQPLALLEGAGVSPQEVRARAQSWIKGRR